MTSYHHDLITQTTPNRSRSLKSLEERLLGKITKNTEKYLQSAPVFTVDVTLEELTALNTNKEMKASLQKLCIKMEHESWETQAFSATWVDKNGVPLFYYLSHRMRDQEKVSYFLLTEVRN
jgi:hypothetical protein